MLRRVCGILGLQGFLEVTVQDNASLELSDFDVEKHGGVLVDGVGDAQLLADHREALQGRAKQNYGGQSSTMFTPILIHSVAGL